MRLPFLGLPAALLATCLFASCGGGAGTASKPDNVPGLVLDEPDAVIEVAGPGGDALEEAGPGGDALEEAGPEAMPLELPPPWEVPQETVPADDPGPDPAPEAAADLPNDPAADAPADTPIVTPTACRSFQDCASDEVCEFTLGVCQRRSTWTETQVVAHGFHPLDGAPGDVLIVDGGAFMTSSFAVPKVTIGTVVVGGFAVETSENRVLVQVTKAMSGKITVTDPAGKTATCAGTFKQAPAGVIECDGTTPAATFNPGVRPAEAGGFAAGYVDLGDDLQTRVFYPAKCGSIRRPPVAGTWPLVLVLHGNGAPHLNYEYLAQLLATWGFVAVMPATDQNMAGDDFSAMLAQVMPLVAKIRGKALDPLNPVLAGVSTTPEIAFIGHSRGTGRTEEVIGADADVAAHTVAAVFLGPVDDGDKVPCPILVFGGQKDSQSMPSNYNGAYGDQAAPKWLVEFPGGNHGSFCDHKVYGYGMLGGMGDQKPTITRPRQLYVVQTFVLPLMQRAFQQAQPFAAQLDSPQDGPDYTVAFQLAVP